MPQDTQVNDLKINVLTEAQYEQIQSPSSTELYLVPETVDTTPTSGSTNPITSGAVYSALQSLPEGVFMCNYNTNTSTMDKTPEQILQAKENGMAVLCKEGEGSTRVYHCTAANQSTIFFESLYSENSLNLIFIIKWVSNSGWTTSSKLLQDKLVSFGNSQNIKTINGNSLLGSGDLTVGGGDVNVQSDWNQSDSTADDYIKNKPQNIVTDASYVHTDNNYTTTEKNKLAGIEAGAKVNVQSDWDQSDSTADDYIKNKPTIPTVPTNVGAFTNDANYISGPSQSSQDNILTFNDTSGNEASDSGISIQKIWEDVDVVSYIGNTEGDTSAKYIRRRWIIKSDGDWTNAYNVYNHCVIPVDDIRKVTIVANSTAAARISFFKSYTFNSNTVEPTSEYASVYTSYASVSASTTKSYDVPTDAKFLYVTISDNNYTRQPAHIYMTGIGITEHNGDGSGFIKDDGSVDNTEYQPALPAYTNNGGKVLAVNSGATDVEWIKPVIIYSGSSAPASSLGSDGDIYIQIQS